jgi:hypothetical protein
MVVLVLVLKVVQMLMVQGNQVMVACRDTLETILRGLLAITQGLSRLKVLEVGEVRRRPELQCSWTLQLATHSTHFHKHALAFRHKTGH